MAIALVHQISKVLQWGQIWKQYYWHSLAVKFRTHQSLSVHAKDFDIWIERWSKANKSLHSILSTSASSSIFNHFFPCDFDCDRCFFANPYFLESVRHILNKPVIVNDVSTQRPQSINSMMMMTRDVVRSPSSYNPELYQQRRERMVDLLPRYITSSSPTPSSPLIREAIN